VNRQLRPFIGLILITFISISCGENTPFQRHLFEGFIEYEVTYPELDSGNIMLEMMPDKMLMHFKDNKFKSELKTAAGIIEISVMADSKTEEMYNLVKIFSDYYALKMNKVEAIQMTNQLPDFTIVDLNETVTIADASCKKIQLDFKGAKPENYTFCYTDEIKIASPNWFTPYNEIDGVLLDYIVENYGMVMRLKAVAIYPEEIEDELFEIDEEYKFISTEEFDDLVVRNLEIFIK
jgi:hypothetical protein